SSDGGTTTSGFHTRAASCSRALCRTPRVPRRRVCDQSLRISNELCLTAVRSEARSRRGDEIALDLGPLYGERTRRERPAPVEVPAVVLDELHFPTVGLTVEAQLNPHEALVTGPLELEQQFARLRLMYRRRWRVPEKRAFAVLFGAHSAILQAPRG